MDLLKETRKFRSLEKAWKRVRDNGRKSRSKRTRAEIEEYGSDIHRNIRSLVGQLGRGSFKFDASRGWAEPAKSYKKKARPVVITPVRSRIVQRAILDVLLEQAGIQSYINQPFSFGGIQKTDPDAVAAVPGAIQATVDAILNGSRYFVRSDISGFFARFRSHPSWPASETALKTKDFAI